MAEDFEIGRQGCMITMNITTSIGSELLHLKPRVGYADTRQT